MALTAGDLVVHALTLIGATAAGELPNPYEAQDGLYRLNDLLANWETQQLQIFSIVNFSQALASGINSVTMGPSGTFNTTRPIKIESAGAIRAGVRTPIEPVGALRWARIFDKAATAKVPELLYNDNANPLVTLNFWPSTADTSTTLDLYTWGEYVALTTLLFPDLVIDGANAAKVTSASYTFVAGDVGNFLNVPAGYTGFTAGRYSISSVAGGAATLSANVGTLGQTGGVATYDQPLALPPGFWKAIRFNLALDLMPEYGRVDAATAKMIAKTALTTLVELRGLQQSNQSATEAPPVPDAPAPQNPNTAA
jgi:hypothetical protein